jgi:hypothetical protein
MHKVTTSGKVIPYYGCGQMGNYVKALLNMFMRNWAILGLMNL